MRPYGSKRLNLCRCCHRREDFTKGASARSRRYDCSADMEDVEREIPPPVDYGVDGAAIDALNADFDMFMARRGFQ